MRNNAWIALAIVFAILMLALPESAFTIIDVPNGTNPTATSGDTLILREGPNISITGDDGSDSILFQSESLQTVRLGNQVVENHWVLPGWFCRANMNTTPTADQARYFPIAVPQDHTYASLGVNVSSAGLAGEIARLGIYNANLTSSGLEITSLLLDAGTVAVDSTGSKTLTINQSLDQGYYWLAFVTDSATAQFSSCLTSQGIGSFMSGYTETPGVAPGKLLLRDNGAGTGALADPATPDGAIHLNPGGVGISRLLE